MKKLLYLSAFIATSFVSNGQSIERQVFNSFGSSFQSGGTTLDVNAGEPITATYLGAGTTVFQGFLQPVNDPGAGIFDKGNLNGLVHIWPNPTTEGLYVAFEGQELEGASILVYDLMGKCIVKETLCVGCSQYYLDLPLLATGMYRVRIALTDDRFIDQEFIKASH